MMNSTLEKINDAIVSLYLNGNITCTVKEILRTANLTKLKSGDRAVSRVARLNLSVISKMSDRGQAGPMTESDFDLLKTTSRVRRSPIVIWDPSIKKWMLDPSYRKYTELRRNKQNSITTTTGIRIGEDYQAGIATPGYVALCNRAIASGDYVTLADLVGTKNKSI